MILIKMEKNGKLSNSVSWTHQDMLLKYREKKAPTTKHSSATQLWENDDKINAQRSFYLEPVKKILVSTGNREQNCTMEGGLQYLHKDGFILFSKSYHQRMALCTCISCIFKNNNNNINNNLQPTFHVVHFWHANTVHFQQEELIPFTYFQ